MAHFLQKILPTLKQRKLVNKFVEENAPVKLIEQRSSSLLITGTRTGVFWDLFGLVS